MEFSKNFGINEQAVKVLEELKKIECDNFFVDTAAWYNGRETGIVFSLNGYNNGKLMNIVVYEHRSSDQICVLKWTDKLYSLNPPTVHTLPEGVFKDKLDYTKAFDHGEHKSVARWIYSEFVSFLEEEE